MKKKRRKVYPCDALEIQREYGNKHRLKVKQYRPWIRTYKAVYARCRVKSAGRIYSYYGGRGIKLLMTQDDFKTLWFRDKAYEMKKPSIDRIDSNGNYEIGNCRYIEQAENARRVYENKHSCVHGHEYNEANTMFNKNGWRVCRECKRLRRLKLAK